MLSSECHPHVQDPLNSPKIWEATLLTGPKGGCIGVFTLFLLLVCVCVCVRAVNYTRALSALSESVSSG